jgi:plasmid stabilization system protein ParE
MSRGKFEVFWSEAAIEDLERIVDFIAQEAPLAAERLFDAVAENPQRFSRFRSEGGSSPSSPVSRLQRTASSSSRLSGSSIGSMPSAFSSLRFSTVDGISRT